MWVHRLERATAVTLEVQLMILFLNGMGSDGSAAFVAECFIVVLLSIVKLEVAV